MTKLLRLLSYTFSNFGPIIIFLVVNRVAGLKVAVAATMIWVVGELLICLRRRQRPSTFFIFSALISLVFGVIDLFSKDPFVFRYEAVATSMLFGIYFGATILIGKPIIQEFAEKADPDGDLRRPNARYYLRILTWIWTIYFFAKAIVYFYVAREYSIESATAIRAVVGNASFLGLLLGERILRKQIISLMKVFHLFPEAA